MPAFSSSIFFNRSASMTAAAASLGENRTRFRRPSANATSAHHLAVGFKYCVPSFVSG
jgi:hypothetical protein